MNKPVLLGDVVKRLDRAIENINNVIEEMDNIKERLNEGDEEEEQK